MAKKHARIQRLDRWGNAIVISANGVGAGLTIFYFVNLSTPDEGISYTLPWIAVIVAVVVGLIMLGSWLSDRIQGPLWKWFAAALEGDTEPPSQQVRRLALGMPALAALTDAAMWVLAALFFGISSALSEGGFQWGHFFQAVAGATISGFITVCLVYFAVEQLWRGELPLFFEGCDPAEFSGWRMSVRTRMLLLFILATLPMLMLSLLSYNQAVRIASAAEPQALLPQLLRLELIIGAAGLLTSIALAISLSASLIRPLVLLSRRIRAAGQGDLTVRVPVESNDEIGVLSASFNQTAASLEQRDRELQTLYQISRSIGASFDLGQTLQRLLLQIRQIIPSETARISLFDEAGGRLILRAILQSGLEDVRYLEKEIPLDDPLIGQILHQKSGLLVSRGRQEGLQVAGEEGAGSYLGVPLLLGEQRVGVLELISQEEEAFDAQEQRLLETIAPQAATAIANALQVQERERLLQSQIEQLSVEVDRAKRDRQVAKITESEFFQHLQQEAERIRARKRERQERKKPVDGE